MVGAACSLLLAPIPEGLNDGLPAERRPTNATDGSSPTDTTATAVLTAAEVNATNAVVNDIVTELGANLPGSAADVGARIAAVEAAAAAGRSRMAR